MELYDAAQLQDITDAARETLMVHNLRQIDMNKDLEKSKHRCSEISMLQSQSRKNLKDLESFASEKSVVQSPRHLQSDLLAQVYRELKPVVDGDAEITSKAVLGLFNKFLGSQSKRGLLLYRQNSSFQKHLDSAPEKSLDTCLEASLNRELSSSRGKYPCSKEQPRQTGLLDYAASLLAIIRIKLGEVEALQQANSLAASKHRLCVGLVEEYKSRLSAAERECSQLKHRLSQTSFGYSGQFSLGENKKDSEAVEEASNPGNYVGAFELELIQRDHTAVDNLLYR